MAKVTATDDTSNAVKVTLDGNTADISAGGHGSPGHLELFDSAGKMKIQIGTAPGQPRPLFGNIFINGYASSLLLRDDTPPIAERPEVLINNHSIVLKSDAKVQRMKLDGRTGILSLQDDAGKDRVVLNAVLNSVMAYGAFGGEKADGYFALFPASATSLYDWQYATITMNGKTAAVTIGGGAKAKTNGSITVVDQNLNTTIYADGGAAVLTVGNITLDGKAGTISASGNIIAGGSQQPTTERIIPLTLSESNQTIQLFPLEQDGAYSVELAACYSQPESNGGWFGYWIGSWTVFTYRHTTSIHQFDQSGGGGGQATSGQFWNTDPSISANGNNVVLSISGLFEPPGTFDGTATVSVKALFGSLA